MSIKDMTSNLTYKELIDYLDRYNTDPMVRRLLEMVMDKEETIIEGLIEVGMDPFDCRIEGDDGYYLPGPYIQKLKQDVDFQYQEAQDWEEKYYDMKDERDKLKARSVADLLQEMKFQVDRANSERESADRVATQLKMRNAELEEKINVWTIMEK
jgi:hypothetical protein